MTLPTMAFSPAIGLRDNITYPNPATGTAAREQVQGRNDELRDFINGDFSDAIDKRTITAKTTTYTVISTDLNTDITCTGTFTVTLPLISTTGFGVGFRCRVSNVSTGVITVASTSTDTIAGVASVTINGGKSIEITADATGKWTVHGFDFTDLISTVKGDVDTLQTDVLTKENALISFVDDTASRTLTLTDANKKIRATHASVAINYTVPPNASVAFPVGTYIIIEMTGAAQVAVVAGSGVTITLATKLKVNGQGTSAVLLKENTNLWSFQGSVKA